MTEIDGITLVFKQLYAPGVVDRLLECDWCGYEIEGDELVKTLKAGCIGPAGRTLKSADPIRRRSERSHGHWEQSLPNRDAFARSEEHFIAILNIEGVEESILILYRRDSANRRR